MDGDEGIDLNDLPGALSPQRCHPFLQPLRPGPGSILPNPSPRRIGKSSVKPNEELQRVRRKLHVAEQRLQELTEQIDKRSRNQAHPAHIFNQRIQMTFGIVVAALFIALFALAVYPLPSVSPSVESLDVEENHVEIIDSDGDGFTDDIDAFPFDFTQWSDLDGDGYGDNPDGNASDAFPEDPDEWVDTDGDGVGDNGDACPVNWGLSPTGCSDTDGDGFSDDVDAFPWEPTQWADRDGDGYGDNPDGEDKDHFPDDPTRHSFLEKLWFYFVFIMCTLILGALIVILSIGHPLAGAGMGVLTLLLGWGYFLFL